MPTSVYRQLDPPLAIEAGPAESVHIDGGGDAELELPENYDDDAYEGYEAMLQLQAEAAASESLALRLGSPRFERPSALSPFAEEEVDEASASPEREAPPPPADSGGASSSLAPVTERSANWRRQLAERSAADAQEEAPPPPAAAARGGKRPVDGRRAAAARLGKQIAEKERQKEEAIADAKLAKMNVSLLQQRCEGLVDELRRMHAAEAAEAREQAARDEKEARRAYAEAERAARAEVEEMMGGFFSELTALDGFADAGGFADSDDDDGAGGGGEGDGDAVAAGLRRGDPSVFDAVAAAFPEHFAAARAALAEAPPPPPRPARGASAGRRGGPTAAAPTQRARPAAPAAAPAARQREASAAASAKRLPGLKATYGKGLGAYAAKAEKPRRAGSGGRSRKELGVVAAPAARSATARLADGRLALPSR